MLKIRLMRIGAKKRPFYRVVLVDERSKRTGGYIELLGTYNPLTEPKDIKLKQDRIDYWIKKGAQPSEGYLRMIGKAPQRPPRKPKKEKKESEEPEESKESKVEETAKSSDETSENSDSQKISESENQKSDLSETPTPSDSSDIPSSSESSEKGESKT